APGLKEKPLIHLQPKHPVAQLLFLLLKLINLLLQPNIKQPLFQLHLLLQPLHLQPLLHLLLSNLLQPYTCCPRSNNT
ncbi:hypothetical protein U1Q18_047469, partial [Sarracenia purpurea var. burkii]